MTEIVLNTTYCPSEPAIVEKYTYQNGSTALLIRSAYDGELLITATVAIDLMPDEGNVFIKDYSENEGVLNCLIDEKVVSKPLREHQAGFAIVHECKLLV
jgi:hypothetical protein